MAAGKIFAISFAINATMGGSFTSALSRGSALLSTLQAKTRTFNAEQRQLTRLQQQAQNTASLYAKQIESLKAQYQSGKVSETQYHTAVSRAKQKMDEAGASALSYGAKLSQLEKEANQATNTMQRLAKAQAARQAAASKMSAAWTGLRSTASTGMMLGAPLIGAIETAANFEAAMSKVKAITRSSGEDMQKLTENARMLGATTQFSAIQAADAMSYLGMAGWNANQIIAGMPGLLALAAAGGTDLARTADIVSDDLTAFGMNADQAGHMADVFAVTVTRTNTNVEMLGETMKYAAPVAKAFGVSMEETAALAGLMANSGIKASQAGTALRSGFLRLSGPPKQAATALDRLGISMSDITAQQKETQAALESLGISMSDMNGPRKMSAILTELKEKTAGLGREEKLATLKMIFGTEAATGWLAVLDAGPDVFNKLVEEMDHCDGEAQKMADTMMNNAKGSMIQLKSALESLGISVGSIFLPAITAAGKGAANVIGNLAGWVSNHEQLTASILGTAGAFLMLIPGIQTYRLLTAAVAFLKATLVAYKVTLGQTRAVQLAASAATSLHAGTTLFLANAMKATRHPITSMQSALTLLQGKLLVTKNAATGMATTLVNGFRTLPSMLISTAAALPGVISNALSAIPTALAGIAAAGLPIIVVLGIIIGIVALVAANFNQFRETAINTFNHISGTAGAWMASIQATFQGALNTITGVWNSVTGQALQSSELIGAIFNNIGFVIGAAFDIAAGVVGTAVSVIINIVAAMAQIIGGFINIIAGLFTGDWDRAWKGAAQVTDGLFDGTIGTLKSLAGGISNTFDTLMGKADEVRQKAEQAKAAASESGENGTIDNGQAVADAQEIASATGNAAGSAQELSSNMQQAGSNTEQASGSMQQLQSFMQQMPNVTQSAFSGMGDQSAVAAQAVTTNLQQIPNQTQAAFQQIPAQATAALQQIPEQTQGVFSQMQPMAQQSVDAIAAEYNQLAAKCQPGGEAFVQAAGTWGQSAYNSIAQWADQMAAAVQSKLSSAWSSVQSQFSAGLNVNVTTTNTVVTKEVKANARGGIYRKGAFLTTFAEESPEAAIPLDGSKRAVDLWKMAGRILGMDTNDEGDSNISPSFMPTPQFNASKVGKGREISVTPMANASTNTLAEPPAAMSAINLTLNFYGEQEPESIKKTVLDAAHKVQKSFAEQLREYQREKERLAYE